MPRQNITLHMTDGDRIHTPINGSRTEIINYYQHNNCFAGRENPQVARIEFEDGESVDLCLYPVAPEEGFG